MKFLQILKFVLLCEGIPIQQKRCYMRKTNLTRLSFGAVFIVMLMCSVPAYAQATSSPNAAWSGSRGTPPTASDRQAELNQAQVQFQAEHGGLVVETFQIYNGAVTYNYSYNGPVSSSSSNNVGAETIVSNTVTGVTGNTTITVLPSTSVAGGANQSAGSSSTSTKSP